MPMMYGGIIVTDDEFAHFKRLEGLSAEDLQYAPPAADEDVDAPEDEPLTPGQRAAITRAANRAAREQEGTEPSIEDVISDAIAGDTPAEKDNS